MSPVMRDLNSLQQHMGAYCWCEVPCFVPASFLCTNQWVRNGDRATLKPKSDSFINTCQENLAGDCPGVDSRQNHTIRCLEMVSETFECLMPDLMIKLAIVRKMTRVYAIFGKLAFKRSTD